MELTFRNTEFVTALNESDDERAAEVLSRCLDIPRWVGAMVDARPFVDVAALRAACGQVAAPFTGDEIDGALQSHPRIGDRPVGTSAEAIHARAEQSGVDTSDSATALRLADGNREYEQRFGRVFLIRAAGRDAGEILEQLEARLKNDPATERVVVEGQLREIAAIRATGGAPRA